MTEKLPQSMRSAEENEALFQKLVSLWRSMRFYPKHDMDGEFVSGETVIVENVVNLAVDSSQDQIPPEV